ncbi:Cc8K15.2-like protein [Daphnia magna]|uniref:Cc8K15.2-like protein n=1 Tax=Daphnia magna TaxID=35525 RepID=A0A164P951_9CRUS|nr:Cc8K15.2-like protein [Daphnia magna]
MYQEQPRELLSREDKKSIPPFQGKSIDKLIVCLTFSLLEKNLVLEYRSCRLHKNADSLSRTPVATIASVATRTAKPAIKPEENEWVRLQHEDEYCKKNVSSYGTQSRNTDFGLRRSQENLVKKQVPIENYLEKGELDEKYNQSEPDGVKQIEYFEIIESLAEKNKLPTNRTVMARFLHMRTENALKPYNDLISALFGELEMVWAKSGIPIKQKKHVTLQLTLLVDKYRKLKEEGAKNNVSSKPTRSKKENTLQTKIKCFQEKLDDLCDISNSDCYQTLRSSRRKNWKNNWAFYEKQKTTRT